MDKNETKWLSRSFKLILIGILFWVVKPRYITFFCLEPSNFFNQFGLELIGTLFIMVGLVITRQVYPFFYTFFAEGFCVLVLAMNVLNIIFYNNPIYQQINVYDTFVMSLCLFFICKTLENGMHYFGAPELARKWRYFAIIIFFGFTIPFYLITTLFVCQIIEPEEFVVNAKLIWLSLPFVLTILSALLFYLVYLIKSFNFLSKVQKENN